MAYRKVSFAAGEYYHLYNRGNSKQLIFRDDADRLRFVHLLFLSNSTKGFSLRDLKHVKDIFVHPKETPLVSIGAYTLMPNHFHILVTQSEKGSISTFMQKLTTGYSMYFNQKYKRSGSLFEGKFKAQHAENDRYLKYLFSYIHLNALKLKYPKWKERGTIDTSRALDFLSDYVWSSYVDYNTSNRSRKAILDTSSFPKYFSTRESLEREIFDWLSYPEEGPRG